MNLVRSGPFREIVGPNESTATAKQPLQRNGLTVLSVKDDIEAYLVTFERITKLLGIRPVGCRL